MVVSTKIKNQSKKYYDHDNSSSTAELTSTLKCHNHNLDNNSADDEEETFGIQYVSTVDQNDQIVIFSKQLKHTYKINF